MLERSPAELASPFGGIKLPRLAGLAAFGFASMVIWSRLSVFLHELGHAVSWAAFSGHVESIHVELFAGGYVKVSGESGCPAFLFHLSGILVNLLLALIVGFAAWRLLKSGRVVSAHFLAWGAALNAAGATHYSTLGAFYQFGDPAPYPRLWLPSLALLALLVPAAIILWARSLVPLLRDGGEPTSSPPGPAGLAVAVIPLAVYAACLWAEKADFAALKAEKVAVERAIAVERARRVYEWREEHPGVPPPSSVTEVRADEVRRPFPLTALVLLLDTVFIAAALLARRLHESATASGLSARLPWPEAFVAAGATLVATKIVFGAG